MLCQMLFMRKRTVNVTTKALTASPAITMAYRPIVLSIEGVSDGVAGDLAEPTVRGVLRFPSSEAHFVPQKGQVSPGLELLETTRLQLLQRFSTITGPWAGQIPLTIINALKAAKSLSIAEP